jgi:hypothetical protein
VHEVSQVIIISIPQELRIFNNGELAWFDIVKLKDIKGGVCIQIVIEN